MDNTWTRLQFMLGVNFVGLAVVSLAAAHPRVWAGLVLMAIGTALLSSWFHARLPQRIVLNVLDSEQAERYLANTGKERIPES